MLDLCRFNTAEVLHLQPVVFEYSSSSKNGEGQMPLPALIDMAMPATDEEDFAMKSQR